MSARARPPELLQAGAGVHDPGSKGGSVDPYVGTISDQIIWFALRSLKIRKVMFNVGHLDVYVGSF